MPTQIRGPPEQWCFQAQTEQLHHINSIRAAHLSECAALFRFLPSRKRKD